MFLLSSENVFESDVNPTQIKTLKTKREDN